MNPLGFVIPGATIGLGSLLIRPRRGFALPASKELGPAQFVQPQVVVEESHHDDLEITQHPIEMGAVVADHAFKQPMEIVIRCAWSNSPSASGGLVGAAIGAAAAIGGPVVGAIASAGATINAAQSLLTGNAVGQVRDIYEKLLKIQESRIPFDVFTGKRAYKSMLFKSLRVDTTPRSENALLLIAVCRQVIIVRTRIVEVGINPDAQALPEQTTPISDAGKQQLQPGSNFKPDSATFGTAIEGLQGGVAQVQQIFGTLPAADISGITSAALNSLPSALEPVQAALSGITDLLPRPMEIPLLSVPQELGITINGALADAQGALSQAVQQLPNVLEQAQPAIAAAVKQLPAVVDQLPSAFGGLQDVLSSVQTRIQDVLKKVPQVLSRAPVPGI